MKWDLFFPKFTPQTFFEFWIHEYFRDDSCLHDFPYFLIRCTYFYTWHKFFLRDIYKVLWYWTRYGNASNASCDLYKWNLMLKIGQRSEQLSLNILYTIFNWMSYFYTWYAYFFKGCTQGSLVPNEVWEDLKCISCQK